MTELFPGGLPEQRRPVLPLSINDITELEDGSGYVADWRLAELLGFKHDRQIRELIQRHRKELSTRAKLSYCTTVLGRRGPAAEVCLLDRKAALFIIAQSGAQNAGPLLWLMIEVFDAWLSGKAVITDSQTATAIADATEQAFKAAPILTSSFIDGMEHPFGFNADDDL